MRYILSTAQIGARRIQTKKGQELAPISLLPKRVPNYRTPEVTYAAEAVVLQLFRNDRLRGSRLA